MSQTISQPKMVSAKTPAEVLNYLVDFTPEISANEPGDTISAINSVTVQGNSGALSVVSSTINSGAMGIGIRLSGGNPGILYTITVNVSLVSGQIFERCFRLPVVAQRG
jgi:hypothetical protein